MSASRGLVLYLEHRPIKSVTLKFRLVGVTSNLQTPFSLPQSAFYSLRVTEKACQLAQ